MANPQSLQSLLDQTGWIHVLARRLVADPHLADDLAQDTCIDALERQPDALRPLRGWLATVMRNNLAKLRSGERNRAVREERVSRTEIQPSTLDVVERVETHRNVVLALLALDEPYRSTLLMRFFEQLSYGEIARRTGVTRASVNSRITRGLERLRQRLETTYGGDRRALYLALTPLAKLPTGVATTILGVKIMNLAIGTIAASLLAVTVTVGVSRGRTAHDPVVSPVATVLPAELREPGAVPEPVLLGAPEPTRAALPRRELDPQEIQQTRREQKEQKELREGEKWKTELFQTRTLAPTVKSLAVNASSGDVEVLESVGNQLEITAKVRAGNVPNEQLTQVFEDHVDVTEEDGVLTIEDKHRGARGWNVSFVVRVPGALALSANSGSGDILVRRAHGRVSANTGSGDVRVDLPAERVQALSANTGSGDVVVEVASIEGKLDANTGSGDVIVHVIDPSSPGAGRMNSGSGDVHLIVPPGVVGTFDLETNGDAIVLPRALGIEVRTDVSGRRMAHGSIGSGGGNYKLASGSGELEVELGNALPAKGE